MQAVQAFCLSRAGTELLPWLFVECGLVPLMLLMVSSAPVPWAVALVVLARGWGRCFPAEQTSQSILPLDGTGSSLATVQALPSPEQGQQLLWWDLAVLNQGEALAVL